MPTSTLEGGCVCGAVRYRITGPRIDAGYCHCHICQRASGAPVVMWLTVPTSGFAYTQGAPASYASSHKARREFCGRCGSQLALRDLAKPQEVDVTVGSLDRPDIVPPEYHIWTSSRIEWFDTKDVLPRHDDNLPAS